MRYFNIKKLFSDTKKVIVISACLLLLIGNIAGFAFLGSATMIPSFIVVIISNLITILITFVIYKPISKIIDEYTDIQAFIMYNLGVKYKYKK